MAIKKYKPTTSSRRGMSGSAFDEITASSPERSLLRPIARSGGRNSGGRITVRRRGGGHKRRYRVIDFKRDKHGVPARVATIEYDPNRSCRIALLHYRDGEKRYMIAPAGLQVGMMVSSGPDCEVLIGNAMPLSRVPLGTFVHNIELIPGCGGKMVRSAGGGAQLMAKEGKYAHLRLPSGEVRLVMQNCYATIGQVGNIDHENISLGKAGRTRWMGRRPKVRGVAMNPVDHPLGGGEGKASGGRPACNPWGKPDGLRTRKKGKLSGKYIVRSRHAKK